MTMRLRLAHISLFVAWFLASGSQWDFVQTFAWTKMFVGYVRTMPAGKVLTETFDTGKHCALCQVVAQAKQHEQESSPRSETNLKGKITFVCAPANELIFATPIYKKWRDIKVIQNKDWLTAPPVPPPRGIA